jgi:monoterpene epsilon-lactone hydrolase
VAQRAPISGGLTVVKQDLMQERTEARGPSAAAGIVDDAENESISPQARSMLARLQQQQQLLQFNKKTEASSTFPARPLTVESAQKARAQMQALVRPATLSMIDAFGLAVEEERIGDVTITWLTPQGSEPDGRIAFYIHGGGYVSGDALDPVVVTLARQSGLRTAAIDYRLAPEHPFPAGRDDCLAVYRELLKRFGADRLVVYGGSAGAGMVLSMTLMARDAGLPMPAAVALMSPWSDLTRTGDSYYANEGRDPILNESGTRSAAAAYAGDKDPASAELSPVYADYRPGFPVTLITTGTRDLFLSNCVRLYRVLRRAGVSADLQVWEGMWHSFEGFTAAMPESEEAIALIATFLKNPPVRC